MSFVYAIAFSGQGFLMVFNTRRKGWEMPGGRVEEGETAEQAAVREFQEETGQRFLPRASAPFRDGRIFSGDLIVTGGSGEMEWDLFEDLPDKLAFPEVEYREQLLWARRSLAGKQ